MGMPRTEVAVGFRRDRDNELREAHRAAFERIHQARLEADYQTKVSQAVADLIDACESYANRA